MTPLSDQSADEPDPVVCPEAAGMSASIIICTYSFDRWPDLEAAVESVLTQIRPEDELLLVIDHNDALATAVQNRFPQATVVENVFERGLSGARNTGVRRAAGDIVLFLDDDAVAADGWLAAHVSAYARPSVAGTAGYVRPAWDPGTPPSWWPELFDWVVGCNDERSEPSGATVRNPVGANMGFRRTQVLDVGGFSLRLGRTRRGPLGCEETELAIRIVQANPGSRVVFVREAECDHKVHADRATWRYFRSRCLAEGKSKAVVAKMTGLSAATASERSYTRSVLRNVASDVVRPKRFRRTLAALGGLCFALAGFAPGLILEQGPLETPPLTERRVD